jgi:hypothetical protein
LSTDAQAVSVNSTPSGTYNFSTGGTYSNVASIAVTASGPGSTVVDAQGYLYNAGGGSNVYSSACGANVGIGTATNAVSTNVNISNNGAATDSFYKGYGYSTSTYTGSLGYQFTPSTDIVVYGGYSNYSYTTATHIFTVLWFYYGYIRIWDTSNSSQIWSINNYSTGTWTSAYTSSTVILKAGHTYAVTMDANASTFAYDNDSGCAHNYPNGYNSSGLVTIGPGAYTSTIGNYPGNLSNCNAYGGVGLYYYPVSYSPVHVSGTFSVPSSGAQTYYLNGTSWGGNNGSCYFVPTNMNATFVPAYAQ